MHIIVILFLHGPFGGMLIMIMRNTSSYVTFKPEVLQYLENRWDPHPYSKVYILASSAREHVMYVVMIIQGDSKDVTPLNRKCPIETVLILTPKLQ